MAEVPCPDCDGEGRVLYTRGYNSWDEREGDCETCQGSGQVPLICPECKQECDELVESGIPKYQWCLACALESIECYPDEEAAVIRAKAAQAGQP